MMTTLIGVEASPKNHPITCANSGLWIIIQCRFEINPLKIWIRGQDTIWFRADQCWLGDCAEEHFKEIQAQEKEREDKLAKQFMGSGI